MAAAGQLAQVFGITEWDGQPGHLTQELPDGQAGTFRIDVVVMADLQQQDANGEPIYTTEVVDGEEIQVPVMHGLPHVDVVSEVRIDNDQADQFLVFPVKPLHNFYGIVAKQLPNPPHQNT